MGEGGLERAEAGLERNGQRGEGGEDKPTNALRRSLGLRAA